MLFLVRLVDDEGGVRNGNNCVSFLVDGKRCGPATSENLVDYHVLWDGIKSFGQVSHP